MFRFPTGKPLWLTAAALLAFGVPVVLGAGRWDYARPDPLLLPAAVAEGVRLDTLLLGGYASGSFNEAVQLLASDLSGAERMMVGQHLDKVFAGVLQEGGLGRSGRLRVAYERARRPDGSTRSIRVLAAEAAVAGNLHTAFLFESDGAPGYFDPFGRSLDRGGWLGPLAELRISSPFGARRMHPILNRVLPHTGVDYAAPYGTPVKATGDGVVSAAGASGGYGNMVDLHHPSGYSTRYAHLSRLAPGLSVGRMVRQGEVIGFVGMSGLATGPHLHYEVRRQGLPVDPVRMAAVTVPGRDLEPEPGWSSERARLDRLLARTPTLLHVHRD